MHLYKGTFEGLLLAKGTNMMMLYGEAFTPHLRHVRAG
jgi:hypothetical protein